MATLGAAQADRCVAYLHTESLLNAPLDARVMRDTLQRLGFEVVYGEDLDRKQMGQALARSADPARVA